MAHVLSTITVLCLLFVLRGSEARKRSFYFRQDSAKTNDKTIDCCMKLIAENSMAADFNHTNGHCYTSAVIDANSTEFIKFQKLDLLFSEINYVETGELPALLGYREESQEFPIPTIFHVELLTPGDNDWIMFDFQDGGDTRFTTMLAFASNKTLLRRLDSDTIWRTQDEFIIDGPDDVVTVEIKQYTDGVQVYLSNGEFGAITHAYEPFDNIRFVSTFANCSRISFKGHVF